MKNNEKKKLLFSNILILAGILLIAVPAILTYANTKRNEEIIEEFLDQSEQALSDTEALNGEDVESFYIPETVLAAGNGAAEDSASATGQVSGPSGTDPAEDQDPPGSANNVPAATKKPLMSREEIKKRMTGVLIIEKIDVRMIIMDGTDEETLRVAAGRLPGTDKLDEVGNCVLAGHRSYTFGKYFNRLDELEPGDKITVQTPEKTLHYEVYKKLIVEPDDFSITNKNDTDKILTLFTCHPVAVASHRLVVHAKQTE